LPSQRQDKRFHRANRAATIMSNNIIGDMGDNIYADSFPYGDSDTSSDCEKYDDAGRGMYGGFAGDDSEEIMRNMAEFGEKTAKKNSQGSVLDNLFFTGSAQEDGEQFDEPAQFSGSKAARRAAKAGAAAPGPAAPAASPGGTSASAASLGKSKVDAKLIKAMTKVYQSAISKEDDFHSAIMDTDSAIKCRVIYPFKWSGGQAKTGSGAPAEVTLSEGNALQNILGEKLAKEKNQYVRLARIVESDSTAPYPLGFVLSGIQGKSVVPHAFKVDGSPVTFRIPSGYHKHNEVVHELSCDNMEVFRQHGNARLRDGKRAIHMLPGQPDALVDPNTHVGMFFAANAHKFADDAANGKSRGQVGLPLLHKRMPMYVVPVSKALAGMKEYNDKVLSQLPRTNFSKHKAWLTRFDRSSADDSGLSFGDASDAAGLTETGVKAANRASHTAYVTVEYLFVDPAKFMNLNGKKNGASDK